MALWIGAALSALPRIAFGNNEVTKRVGSLLASVAIIVSLQYPSATDSLNMFTGHILADTIMGVKSNLHLIHHTATYIMACITLSYLYTLPKDSPNYQILHENTKLILCMEITTPFLHLAWLLKHFKERGFALAFGFVTVLFWGVRLIIPLVILQKLGEYPMDDISKKLLTSCICALFLLQVYWGYKLVEIVSAFSKTIKKTV